MLQICETTGDPDSCLRRPFRTNDSYHHEGWVVWMYDTWDNDVSLLYVLDRQGKPSMLPWGDVNIVVSRVPVETIIGCSIIATRAFHSTPDEVATLPNAEQE